MATAIDLPLYRALKSLNVPEAEAQAAAGAPLPDLSRFATKEEVRAEVAGVRAEIAQAVQRQTTWLITVVFAAAGSVIAARRLMPQSLPADTVRAIVSQTVRDMQAVPTLPFPPR